MIPHPGRPHTEVLSLLGALPMGDQEPGVDARRRRAPLHGDAGVLLGVIGAETHELHRHEGRRQGARLLEDGRPLRDTDAGGLPEQDIGGWPPQGLDPLGHQGPG